MFYLFVCLWGIYMSFYEKIAMKDNVIFYTMLMLVAFLITPIQADSGFEAKVYTSNKGESLNYRLHLPDDFDAKTKYPFVLFFHGAGERGSDNQKQLIHGVKNILAYSKKSNTPLIIVAPQCPRGAQWVNTPWGADDHRMAKVPATSMLLSMEILKELQTTYFIDDSRIYVTGLSMGGFATWDIIQRMPNTFAAAMPVCGGGDRRMAKVIKDIPIWVFHGDSDSVVKTKRSKDMVAALKKVRGDVKYTEYKGVKHNSWGRAYSDEKALTWLLSQKK